MRKVVKAVIGVSAGVAAGTGAIVAAPAVLGLMGFTAGGIAAGSVAAGMMSSAAIANGGAVAAGSLVAVLQSVGAAGFSAATATGVASSSGIIGGVLGWFSGRRRKRQPTNQPESIKLSVSETVDVSASEDDENEELSKGPSSKGVQKF